MLILCELEERSIERTPVLPDLAYEPQIFLDELRDQLLAVPVHSVCTGPVVAGVGGDLENSRGVVQSDR